MQTATPTTARKSLKDYPVEIVSKDFGGATLRTALRFPGEEGPRYVMRYNGQVHTISALDFITSPERLAAHWKSFLQGNNVEELTTDNMTATRVHEEIRNAKKETIGRDETANGWQILAIDSDGERIGGEPAAYCGGKQVTLRLLKGLSQAHPTAVEFIIEGAVYAFPDWKTESLQEKWDNIEPTGDWWQVSIKVRNH